MGTCVIGIDVGTTCTKALVVDEKGSVLGQGLSGYPLDSHGCQVEQRAEDWVSATVQAVNQAIASLEDKSRVVGISLSTQGGSCVPMDDQGNLIGKAWTWMDTRATQEVAELEQALGTDYFYKTTGWKLSPALDAAKIKAMRKKPELDAAVQYFTTLEMINGFLTDNYAIDPTNGAMRQFYDLEGNCWDEAILKAVGIEADALPEILPTGALVGNLTEKAASQLGLPAGIPVYNGAHDQYCASIGAGAVEVGDLLLSAGTTWVLMAICDKPLFTDSFVAPGKHPVEGRYGAIASLVGSGASLQWFKNGFCPEEFDEINAQVSQRRQATEELFFFPYLAGAHYPLWQGDAKGAFTGLTLEHDKFDFARAIMEGVAFGVRRALVDFQANGMDVSSITIMGGAAKSPVWMDILASCANVPVSRLNQADVCALGAAVIAAKGAGMFSSYEEAAKAWVHLEQVYEPNPDLVEYYEKKFDRYCQMWQGMSQYYKG